MEVQKNGNAKLDSNGGYDSTKRQRARHSLKTKAEKRSLRQEKNKTNL